MVKYSNNRGACLLLLAFLALAGCGTPTPERLTPAQSDLPLVSSPSSAPLSERLGSAIRSAGPEASDTVKVTSIDGIVLLTGQVLSEEAKSRATNAAAFSGGREVLRLTNELRVVDAIDTSGAEQDKRLAASVESLMAADQAVPATRLKTVVDNGRVYLLGRISREQGDAAAELVGRLQGVDAISTVFIYTD
jgi:osmotically-inducible protein OsmY